MKLSYLTFALFMFCLIGDAYSQNKKMSANCCSIGFDPLETISDTTNIFFSGIVSDEETQKGISDVIVHFEKSRRKFTAKTDSDGKFEFRFLPSGEYTIWIEMKDYCSPDKIKEYFRPGRV